MPYIHGPAWFNSDLAVFKTINMNYECNGAVGSQSNPCPLGSGKYVVTNVPTKPYKLDGSTIATGYASTKLGRRVLEMSARYSF